MKTELIITRYNVTSILGWFSLVTGIIGLLLQEYLGIAFWFSVFGVVAGGIVITLADPLRTTVRKQVQLKPLDA